MTFAFGIWHNLRLGGATRGCEEYRMERSRRGLFLCSKLRGGSPSLSRLRIASVEPWGTSIDYVLTHMRFMRSHKFSSFDGRWVGWYPTIPLGYIRDSVSATHGCPLRYRVEHMHYGKVGPAWLFDSHHELWPPMVSLWTMCVVLLGFFPCKVVNWFESPWHHQKWVMARSLRSNVVIQLHIVMLIMLWGWH
jgi:hypothetical protein